MYFRYTVDKKRFCEINPKNGLSSRKSTIICVMEQYPIFVVFVIIFLNCKATSKTPCISLYLLTYHFLKRRYNDISFKIFFYPPLTIWFSRTLLIEYTQVPVPAFFWGCVAGIKLKVTEYLQKIINKVYHCEKQISCLLLRIQLNTLIKFKG